MPVRSRPLGTGAAIWTPRMRVAPGRRRKKTRRAAFCLHDGPDDLQGRPARNQRYGQVAATILTESTFSFGELTEADAVWPAAVLVVEVLAA